MEDSHPLRIGADVGTGLYASRVPNLEDVRRVSATLPGSEERAMTGGAAWFVRGKLYVWECHPWPSVPADMRAIIADELVVGLAGIAADHLRELVTEAWWVQAPKYLRREFDEGRA